MEKDNQEEKYLVLRTSFINGLIIGFLVGAWAGIMITALIFRNFPYLI